MTLGIDASNLRDGGGITHLVELLKVAEPDKFNFTKVIIWSGKRTLDKIEEQEWLTKCYLPKLDKNLIFRMFWQRFELSKLARKAGCAVLFAPGGSYAGNFHPVVTMSRNLLPFEWNELLRYGFSIKLFKMILLRITQTYTFRNADGLIFLTEYAKNVVNKIAKIPEHKTVIIPHGINSRFIIKPKTQYHIENYTIENPFRLIYVSVIEMYKHQWNVAEAVIELRKKGIPVTLDLIGSAYAPALKKLKAKLAVIDPFNKVVNYLKAVSHFEIRSKYAQSDLFIFASSCENMPNILLEAMASGLPIACSNMGPMPEVLEDGGVYFNPLEVSDIIVAIKKLIDSNTLRLLLADKAFGKAQFFSWKICANDTFNFLAEIADKNRK